MPKRQTQSKDQPSKNPKNSSQSNTKKAPNNSKITNPIPGSLKKSDISLRPPRPPREPPIRIKPPKEPRIIQILSNEDTLGEIEDMASTGASLATIDAKLKFPPNTMSKLIEKGKAKKNRYYYDFYLMFRSWVAEARHAAEANMAKRSPEKWLDRNSANKRIESEEDKTLALSAPSNTPTPGIEAAKVLAALKILQEQGISIDEALSKNAIALQPDEKEDND